MLQKCSFLKNDNKFIQKLIISFLYARFQYCSPVQLRLGSPRPARLSELFDFVDEHLKREFFFIHYSSVADFLHLLLMMVCFAGFVTLQMIIVVSRLPLATMSEFGDHATEFTLALWKPHSLLCASCKSSIRFQIIFKISFYNYIDVTHIHNYIYYSPSDHPISIQQVINNN